MELAAAGTDRSVSQYTSDVNTASNAVDDDQSPYVAMANLLHSTPVLLFSFGKAVDSARGMDRRHLVSDQNKSPQVTVKQRRMFRKETG